MMKNKKLWISLGIVGAILIGGVAYYGYTYSQEQAEIARKKKLKAELRQKDHVIENISRYIEGDYSKAYAFDDRFQKMDDFIKNEIKTLNTTYDEIDKTYNDFINNEYFNYENLRSDLPNFTRLKARIVEIKNFIKEKEDYLEYHMSDKEYEKREAKMKLSDEDYDIYSDIADWDDYGLYDEIFYSIDYYKLEIEYFNELLDVFSRHPNEFYLEGPDEPYTFTTDEGYQEADALYKKYFPNEN